MTQMGFDHTGQSRHTEISFHEAWIHDFLLFDQLFHLCLQSRILDIFNVAEYIVEDFVYGKELPLRYAKEEHLWMVVLKAVPLNMSRILL